MTPLKACEIKGVWATPLIPVEEDGKAAINTIDGQIRHFGDVGVQGVYSHGTAAEFHCQTEAQYKAFAETMARTCHAIDLPFQIGACHPFAQETLHRIRFARNLEPSAIQIILPDWVPVDNQSAARFLDGCIEVADGVGLVLYNPPHAKRVLSPQDHCALLIGRPGIVGLKCAGGDASWYAEMAPVLEAKSVFVPGHFMATGLKNGASGSYSNVACLSPAQTVAWYAQCLSDLDHALEVEERLCRFMTQACGPILEAGYPSYTCDKLFAHISGWTQISTRMMWPHSGPSQEMIQRANLIAKKLIPEFM